MTKVDIIDCGRLADFITTIEDYYNYYNVIDLKIINYQLCEYKAMVVYVEKDE